MKNLSKYILIPCLIFGLISCEEDALENVGLSGFSTDQAGAFVAITSSATSAIEGGSVTVTLQVPNPISSDVAVTFSLSGAATNGSDYTVTSEDGVTVSGNDGSGNIVFDITAGGADNVTFDVNFNFDGAAEAAEDVVVTLTGATAANGTPVDLGDPTTNPAGAPVTSVSIEVVDPSVTVGFGALSDVTEQTMLDTVGIPVEISADIPGGSIDVAYSVSPLSSAVDGTDYNILGMTPGMLTITSSSSEIDLEVLPDLLLEESDSILVVISSATASTGLSVELGVDSLIIAFNDNLSTVSFEAGSGLVLSEAAADVASTYLFDIVLSAPVEDDVTVSYSFSNVVAGITSVTSGSVTIEEGTTSGTAVVSIDPSVFMGTMDIETSLVIDGIATASEEVSLSTDMAALTASILIDNTEE